MFFFFFSTPLFLALFLLLLPLFFFFFFVLLLCQKCRSKGKKNNNEMSTRSENKGWWVKKCQKILSHSTSLSFWQKNSVTLICNSSPQVGVRPEYRKKTRVLYFHYTSLNCLILRVGRSSSSLFSSTRALLRTFSGTGISPG